MKNIKIHKIISCLLLLLAISFLKDTYGQTTELKIMDFHVIFEIDENSPDSSFALGSYITIAEFLLNHPEETQSITILLGTDKDLGDISTRTYPVEFKNNAYYLIDGNNEYKITNKSVYAEAIIRINQFTNAKYYSLFVNGKNEQVSNTLYYEVTFEQSDE